MAGPGAVPYTAERTPPRGREHRVHRRITMLQLLATILGLGLIAVGIFLFVLPIPLGAIVLAVGATVLMAGNERFARHIGHLRGRHPRVDRVFRGLERRGPGLLRRTLERSRPRRDRHPEPEEASAPPDG